MESFAGSSAAKKSHAASPSSASSCGKTQWQIAAHFLMGIESDWCVHR